MSDSAASEPTPRVASPWTRRDSVALLVVLAIALVLRLNYIDGFPSLDEIWHLGQSAGNGNPMSRFEPDRVYQSPPSWSLLESAAPWWSVWTHMDGMLNPPLYCMSLRVWREVFGSSDQVAHLYSVAWSVVAFFFLFDTARRAMNLPVAALVGLAFGVSRSQIYFAQELRSYQMVIAIASIAIWLMTRMEIEGATRRRAVALAWLPFPLLLTHYFALGGALAIGVWGLLRLGAQRNRFLVHVVLSGILYLIVWLPFALQQIDDIYTGDAFLAVEHLRPSTWFFSLLSAPIRPIIDRSHKANVFLILAGLLLVLPWLRVRSFKPMLPWAIFLAAGLLPLAAMDLVRSTQHLEFVRYFSITTPAIFLLFAGCLWTLSRPASYLAVCFVIFLGGWYTYLNANMTADCPDLVAEVFTLENRLRPGEALLSYPGSNHAGLNDMILMTANHRPGLLNRPVVSLRSPMTAELRSQLPQRAWLFTDGLREPLAELTHGATDLPDSFRGPIQFQYIHLQWPVPATTRDTPP